MSTLTPREIVSELDKFIIGQKNAKKMVALALRTRWRRQQLDESLREEIIPKNIIMMGPTGVGKTEIARRLSRLAGAPFYKVEATKFTEVGYVGRDVESMIRDLMEIGVNMVRQEQVEAVQVKAEAAAEERLLDLLLPRKPLSGKETVSPFEPVSHAQDTREKLRDMLRKGQLDGRKVEVHVEESRSKIDVMAIPGMEGMEGQIQDMMSKVFPKRKKTRKVTVKEAMDILIQQESERLVDMDRVVEEAKHRVEEHGIIFLDEIDKVCTTTHSSGNNHDVSREGVQRDLLPVVEGCVVNTKYGMVSTNHILFIAAGAFHYAKPSDLIPELQGRFPLRVELEALNREEFYRILTEPQNALTVQYQALMKTEGLDLSFTEDGLLAIADFAQQINDETENIGARRLYTILEKILSEVSFEAPERGGGSQVVDRAFVEERLQDVREDRDLSRYIL
ncbi:MAG: ATP-dependent protease ATPase subunit HslU [Deltaproteobacteria bacterium]|nr:ATP-dependent protease ATPase subunit HslU [Deltaproteobacteria bacterium]